MYCQRIHYLYPDVRQAITVYYVPKSSFSSSSDSLCHAKDFLKSLALSPSFFSIGLSIGIPSRTKRYSTPSNPTQDLAREDLDLPPAVPPGSREVRGPQVKVLILKPRGEVSRISRGGYNLHDKLGWPAADYEEIRVRT